MAITNLKQLEVAINKKLASVLKDEVAHEVVDTMQKHIQSDVYDVYDPKRYERLGYQGGLIDEDNIEVSMVNDNTISVENIRFDGSREVVEIVESGQGYSYQFSYNGVPRPFTENTREELRSAGRLKQVMKQGLQKRGLDVR